MSKEVLHMRVGPLIGEHLLEITQSNISKGNIEYAMSIYPQAFGMTKEHSLMILKNQAVVITDEDGEGVSLKDEDEFCTVDSLIEEVKKSRILGYYDEDIKDWVKEDKLTPKLERKLREFYGNIGDNNFYVHFA